ncbi:strigolactone esterase D14-like [Cornus florida]|uniref:strigolactone esterase D14-like n=1 Tax=Cornus florida TaxID=4283 RepID=UPI0028A09BCA|nr:strigolactone esterase D14-like [Cornus florida]
MDTLCECGGGLVDALNTKIYGNGTQTIVLSHGFGTDQTVWQYLVPFLAYYFKVVVFDLVFSPNVDPNLYDPKKYSSFDFYAQDLICILDQLSVKKSIYVGHSMSAMIGFKAAIRRPELFEHLVLLSGSPRYLNEKGYNGGFRRSDLNSIFKDMHQNFTGWVQSFAPRAISVNNITAIAKFERSLGRMQPEIALSVAKTVFLSDLRTVLPQVRVPSTIIQSEKDIIVPKSVAFYMKRKLGGRARVKILKTQGHFPQLTAYPLLSHVLKRVLCTSE